MNGANDAELSVYEFFELIPDEQSAMEFIEQERWPDGVVCPHCESERVRKLSRSNRYQCNNCRKKFGVRTGTIFERSHIPLRKWLYAIYVMQTARKGISSVQLGKELGIRQSSAWFMLHRIREAMAPDLVKLKGEVEIDEAWVGGLEKNKHSKKKLHKNWVQGKQIVLGMRERDGGPILLRPIPTNTQDALLADILLSVEEATIIYTDEFVGYYNLNEFYDHYVVNHQRGEYVNEHITTNSIESVWAIVKRAHKGIYHQWSKKHGHRYYNEIAFRLVEGSQDKPMLARIKTMIRRSIGARLTYRELTHEDRVRGTSQGQSLKAK